MAYILIDGVISLTIEITFTLFALKKCFFFFFIQLSIMMIAVPKFFFCFNWMQILWINSHWTTLVEKHRKECFNIKITMWFIDKTYHKFHFILHFIHIEGFALSHCIGTSNHQKPLQFQKIFKNDFQNDVWKRIFKMNLEVELKIFCVE